MITVNGDNNHKEKFDGRIWSAPILETPEEVYEFVRSNEIIGRKIAEVKAIGLVYNLNLDYYEDAVLNALDQLNDAQKSIIDDEKLFPENLFICRWMEIDEPLLIKFEDGDILAVDFSYGDGIRMSLNDIPWDIEAGINSPNIDADKLFSEIKGYIVYDVEATSSLVLPDMFNLNPSKERYINKVGLCCKPGERYITNDKIVMTNDMDFTWVAFEGSLEMIECSDVKELYLEPIEYD